MKVVIVLFIVLCACAMVLSESLTRSLIEKSAKNISKKSQIQSLCRDFCSRRSDKSFFVRKCGLLSGRFLKSACNHCRNKLRCRISNQRTLVVPPGGVGDKFIKTKATSNLV